MNPNIHYVTHGLSATPHVLNHIIQTATQIDWEKRPDPERFNLREMMAHMADMDVIWLERVSSISQQPGILIEGRDPDELAKANHYETLNPIDCLNNFLDARKKLLAELESYTPEQWSLTGKHNEFGEISILQIIQFALGHDGYHLRQTVEWIS